MNDELKITLHSKGLRFINRFMYSQLNAETGAILTVDDINLPQAMQEEADKNESRIKTAAEIGKAANSFQVYRQNLG